MTATQPQFSERLTIIAPVEQSIAQIIERSLSVEAADFQDDRSETVVDRNGEEVVIEIFATDLVALRAATNTWFTLLAVAEDTVKILRE